MGERRHVTVMFCDLVDSTGIAAKLDAEEWRDLVGAYIDAASAAVVEMSAGNLTLLGSAANLIVAERARTAGIAISFWTYDPSTGARTRREKEPSPPARLAAAPTPSAAALAWQSAPTPPECQSEDRTMGRS
jgi:class 3 adenylate cyclase